MAQKISFEIGSTFSGEGFRQAQASVGNMNNNIKSAANTASQLASAFGGLDASAAKSMRAITGMINSLMTLNATAIITQAAMIAISAYVDKCNKEMEALQERSEALRASVDKAFNRAVADQIKGVHDEIKSISGEFDRITAQAAAFAAALSGLKGSVATGGIVNLEIEKVNEMLRAHTDAEKATIEATYNLKIATAKAAVSREQWNDKIEAAHTAVVANAERVANCDKEIAIIQQKRAELEEARLQLLGNNSDKAEKLAAAIAQLAAEEEAIRTKQNDLRAKGNVLLVQEQKTLVDSENAEKEMSLAITKATAKIIDVEHASDTMAEKEAQAALAAEAEAKARKERKDQMDEERRLSKEAAEAQKQMNDAAKEVADAERELAEAIARYERNFADNEMKNDIMGQDKRGLAVPVKVQGEIKANIVAHDLEKAINEGLIRSVKDMDRFNRDRAKALDKEEREKWNQLKREKQKYDQLLERSRKTWSQQDKDFVKKFEKLRDTAEAHKKAIEEAKQRLQLAQQREKDNHQNLADIKKKLENLGLK